MVQELLKTGQHSITAITRHDSTSTFPPGVSIARVDYTNESSVVSALQGHDFLIITLAPRVPEGLHATICRAGAQAGIQYIMPNVYGRDVEDTTLLEDWIFGSTIKQGIQDVVDSGANYVVLTCGFWYEWSLLGGENFYGIDIEAKKAVLFDDGTARISSSTLAQCGRAVAALLSLPVAREADGKPALEDWKNKSLYVASVLVSQREMLDSVHRVMGTTDAEWTIVKENSKERTEKALADVKLGDRMAFARALYTRLFYPNGDGDYESSRGLDHAALGLEKEDLDEITRMAVQMKERGESFF